jgi:hypothetical protein
VVITERKDHLDLLADRLSKFAKDVIVLRGGMSARQSRAATESLATIPAGKERILVATGRYLGKGFDDARLDTLFLTMPISWQGILAQICRPAAPLARRETRCDYLRLCRRQRTDAGEDGHETRGRISEPRISGRRQRGA